MILTPKSKLSLDKVEPEVRGKVQDIISQIITVYVHIQIRQ